MYAIRSYYERFEELAAKGEGAYIPYVCAGDPDKDFTLRLVDTLVGAGADISYNFV